jgi:hypothetical protein
VRYRSLTTAAFGLGIVLLLDVLRVWLPSIITIFGQRRPPPTPCAELVGPSRTGSWVVSPSPRHPWYAASGRRSVTLVAMTALALARQPVTAARWQIQQSAEQIDHVLASGRRGRERDSASAATPPATTCGRGDLTCVVAAA